ncbi:VirB4 family type IV secretion/conjugal transfer ATPase [Enterobacter cloacae]|uniref:VirB4 family type IV secretion/conjugal transfer ATPase n=1 Tax=Enterobacter cloacae TaxID=550 RepID=UPI00388E5A9C
MLKEADFEYLLTQTFSCISEASAKTLLERREKSMMETGDRSQSQLEQLNTALDMLLSKEIVMAITMPLFTFSIPISEQCSARPVKLKSC